MSTNPPFEVDTATDPFTTTTNTATKETITVTENTNGKIVITLKGGAGYDAPWIVVHADTVAEATEVLNDEALRDLIDRTKSIAAYFAPAAPKAPAGRPAGATQAPGGQTPPEGYEFKSGVSKKTGKPWKAFMPIDRNSGLDTIWL